MGEADHEAYLFEPDRAEKESKQDGKVYVQKLVDDESFGFYADIRIFSGTDHTITLQDLGELSISRDDGLICSKPTSIGLLTGKTLAPDSQVVCLFVRFDKVNRNKNFTTGTLRVNSTITCKIDNA